MVSVDWDTVKSNTRTLGVWMYWLVGILIIGTISYVLYTRFNKQVASILVFFLSMMALYYYYVKWIIIGDTFQPPVGACPDFMKNLGLIGNTDKQQFLCINTNGVYKLDGFAVENLPKSVEDYTSGSTYIVPTDAGVVDKMRGVVITPPVKVTEADKNTFCGKLNEAKISWIGLCE